MIITNTILKVPDKEFTFKDEIKEYLYQFVENHPFRILNKRIADAHGEDLFSKTPFDFVDTLQGDTVE